MGNNHNGSAQFNRAQTPYPTMTKVEDGIAYDKTGKRLGTYDETQSGAQSQPALSAEDFFAQFGAKPVELAPAAPAQPQSSAQQSAQPTADEFFAQFGAKPIAQSGDSTRPGAYLRSTWGSAHPRHTK